MTGKPKFIKSCVVMACGVLAPLSTQAALISYDITGMVTAAPESPGSFPPDTNWIIGALPSPFAGTFLADDTVAGPTSAFSLMIGGIDIPAQLGLTVLGGDILDPTSLTLSITFCCGPTNGSAVVIGPAGTGFAPQPSNRIVAIQQSNDGPVVDPFHQQDQNWVGTFVVSPSSTVPEPATLALVSLGLAGLGFSRRKKAH